MAKTPTPHKVEGAQSIRRTVSLLRLIARERSSGAQLMDLTRWSGLSRPTTHRILRCLIEEGMVAQHEETRGYLLGPLIYELGLTTNWRPPEMPFYLEAAKRVAASCEDTVYLTMRSGTDAVTVERIDASHPIRVITVGVGERRPLGSGAGGLSILASLDDAGVEEVLHANAREYGRFSITGLNAMRAAVNEVRRTGFALLNDRPQPGMSAIGIALGSPKTSAKFGMSIGSTTARIKSRLDELKSLLRKESAAATRKIAKQAGG